MNQGSMIASRLQCGIAFDPLVASRIADLMKQEALTRREEDILGETMLGLSNTAIVSTLTVTVGIVKTHVKSILSELDAASRTEAVAIAQRREILGEKREWPQRRVQEPPTTPPPLPQSGSKAYLYVVTRTADVAGKLAVCADSCGHALRSSSHCSIVCKTVGRAIRNIWRQNGP
jgi:DNA-binding CsgD family transcriptional regulator